LYTCLTNSITSARKPGGKMEHSIGGKRQVLELAIGPEPMLRGEDSWVVVWVQDSCSQLH